MIESIVWIILAFIVGIVAIAFIRLYIKDGDKRKLMFGLAFLFTIPGYLYNSSNMNPIISMIFKEPTWTDLPIVFAVFLVGLCGYFKIQKTSVQFRLFCVVLLFSLIMEFVPGSLILNLVIASTFSVILIVGLTYKIIKLRESTDFILLFALVLFVLGGTGASMNFSTEFRLLSFFLANALIGLIFISTKTNLAGDFYSVFTLKKELEEANKKLRISEEELVKAQRLAAIGEMATMIAHDLRNPLQSITFATDILQKKYGSQFDENGRSLIGNVSKGVLKSEKIVSDLLDYSREIRIQPSQTNPKQLIVSALEQIKTPLNVKVVDQTEVRPNLELDKEKIERVFVNLIKNAYDAMPSGGDLMIGSEEDSGFVVFHFTDTGVGMSDETISKLWTPLFTTKAQGMGFGTAICKRIVEAHGGEISVKSVVNKGTTFSVKLPLKQSVIAENDVDLVTTFVGNSSLKKTTIS